MAIDTSAPRSRRTFLAAATGAVAATVISAIGRPVAGATVYRYAYTATLTGKSSVKAGRSFVDVNLREIAQHSDSQGDNPTFWDPESDAGWRCFADLQVYRAGVYVAAVRPHYPSDPMMRIYLTKVVSRDTPVAWMAEASLKRVFESG